MSQRMGNSLRKFLLLIWKNTYVIRKRHWLVTILEIVIPLLLFILMAALRASTSGALSVEHITEPTWFPEKSELYLRNNIYQETKVNYAPKNSFTTELVKRMMVKCNLNSQAMKGFESEKAVIDYYNSLTLNENYSSNGFVAIIFEGEAAGINVTVPIKLKYKLRVSTHLRFNTDLLFQSSQRPGPNIYQDTYLTSSFTPFQLFLDKSFIEMVKEQRQENNVSDDVVYIQKMPYPPYVEDNGYSTIARFLLPTVAMLSFITLCVAVVKRVVEEKQTGVRELMRLMGMEGWALWGSWLVDAMLVRLVSLAFVVALLKAELSTDAIAVLPQTDGSVLYFMLLLYTVPAVISCFAVSSFFSRPTLAMCVSIVLWILSQSIPLYYAENFPLGINTKRAMMLLPNMGLYYIFIIMSELEARDIGGQWSIFFESGNGAPGDVSLGDVTFMFFIDSVLYSAITWYIGSVLPGEFGVAKPWNFLFTRDYWMPKYRRLAGATFTCTEEDLEQSKNFERPLSKALDEKDIGVFVRGLIKTYPGALGRRPVKAVRGLSLDLYKGEVTALLGHNGAGKTTTMSILTGMTSASGGSVNILGHNLATELSAVRSSLGLCPQHNLLFKDLTVREHLIFFAMMKGNSYKVASREAEELVEQVHLKDKWNKLASTLSGGMKRKLSLAIALIGGSKVLMLDEPTSGLDPEARREIWDLLLGMRGQRIILISTHFMEEADVLGDTIAIMAHGQVHCCGSSLYLKRLYGAGYHLTVLRKPGCDEASVTRLVKESVPEAELARSNGDQTDSGGHSTGPITFRLPLNSSCKFADMLDKLENSRNQLGIANVSMSVTTMEEVFLKVGELTDAKALEENGGYDETDGVSTSAAHEYRSDSLGALHHEKNKNWALYLQQIWALVLKKWLFTRRRLIHLLFHATIPLLLTLVTIFVSNASLHLASTSEPSRSLELGAYGKEVRVLYSASADAGAQYAAQLYANNLIGVASLHQVPAEVGGVQSGLLKEGNESVATYRKSYIAAASFNKSAADPGLRVTAIYSSNALHASPIAVNLITNALLARLNTSHQHKINVINHPLPSESPYRHLIHQQTVSSGVAIIWLMLGPLGWLFVAAATIILPLEERVCGARQLQVMAGCPYWMVWLSYLLVDVAINTLIAVLTICLIPLLDTYNTFSQAPELGTLFLVLFLYGISGSAFAYVISFVKNSSGSAYALLVVINLMVGLVVNIVVYVLEIPGLGDDGYLQTGTTLRNIFGLFLPHSALTSAFSHFGAIATHNAQCRNMLPSIKKFLCNQGAFHALGSLGPESVACCENLCKRTNSCFKPISYLTWSGSPLALDVSRSGPLLREVLFLALGALWLVLAVLLDCGIVAQAKEYVMGLIEARLHPKDETDAIIMDDDVREECTRVIQKDNDDDVILSVQGLAKDFGIPMRRSRFHAVRGVSFAVAPGECFGLLGVNGAGKTTTFRMLTGAEAPTSGNAQLRQTHLRGDRRHYLSNLGYCPQFDAQLGVLTGRETLALYANLRGLPRNKIYSEINRWFAMLDLLQYSDRPTASYSGGNRRKLSAAMALIGEPPLALLDEPTSGVDPIARRRLWHVLARCQESGQAVVLTSHSMDECEALCNRLGIMVAGQLKCLGPIAHLKQKFGQGFTVMVKVRSASWASSPDCWAESGSALARLREDIEEQLRPCKLRDQHQGLLHYHVMDPNKRWSYLFSAMEELKMKHANILEDYTLSETTLEEVFLSFARHSEQPIEEVSNV